MEPEASQSSSIVGAASTLSVRPLRPGNNHGGIVPAVKGLHKYLRSPRIFSLRTRQGDEQVFRQGQTLPFLFRQEGAAPILEFHVVQRGGNDNGLPAGEHFHPQLEGIQFLLEIHWKLQGRRSCGIHGKNCGIAQPHSAGSSRRNGIYARLEHVAAGPFHQSGINLFAHLFFKRHARLLPGYRHAIHHAAVDVQRIPLYDGSSRERVHQFPFHHTRVGVVKNQRHFRFRQEIHHARLDFRPGNGNGALIRAAFHFHGRRRENNGTQGSRLGQRNAAGKNAQAERICKFHHSRGGGERWKKAGFPISLPSYHKAQSRANYLL